MNYNCEFTPDFLADIKQLDKPVQKRVVVAIEQKVVLHPKIFGKLLKESLSGIRQHRVGDYRVFFVINQQLLTFIGVMHRSVCHDQLFRRLRK